MCLFDYSLRSNASNEIHIQHRLFTSFVLLSGVLAPASILLTLILTGVLLFPNSQALVLVLAALIRRSVKVRGFVRGGSSEPPLSIWSSLESPQAFLFFPDEDFGDFEDFEVVFGDLLVLLGAGDVLLLLFIIPGS